MDQNKQREWEQKINDAGTRFHQEVQRAVQFFDTEVVPEVRKHGSAALRKAAEELHKLAETLEDNATPTPSASTEPTEPR